MPRKLRRCPGGILHHVMKRATARHTIFAGDGDYAAFERVLAEARRREAECIPLNGTITVTANNIYGDIAAPDVAPVAAGWAAYLKTGIVPPPVVKIKLINIRAGGWLPIYFKT